MSTKVEPAVSDTNRRRNQRQPEAFKRGLVEQSYLPGTAVACLARSYGISANQIYASRKLFRDAALLGRAPGHDVALIPVTLFV